MVPAAGRESLLEAVEYDDGAGVRGTIALHGHMSFPPAPDDEVAVVGGTRSFRCAQGYARPALLAISATAPTFVLFRWDIHLFYPPLPHCRP
jgi:hypothetical protein